MALVLADEYVTGKAKTRPGFSAAAVLEFQNGKGCQPGDSGSLIGQRVDRILLRRLIGWIERADRRAD